MPTAEELEQLLDEATIGYLEHEAAEHGWTDDELMRMIRMEACKERGLEHVE